MSTMQTETAVPIPREQLAHSPFQKLRVSKRGNLDELAASMREVGILEPLIARPLPPGDANGRTYELVAGHRRHLAAGLAGLEAVPCLVREYSDDQVLEVLAVENGQRADLHPLDESDVFRALVDHGRTIAQVADKVGRSPAYVAQRLKLADLSEKCRKALDEERIQLGAALALARVPAKLQDEALGRIVIDYLDDDGEGSMTGVSAKRLIEAEFMLRLERAPFPIDDAKLIKKAGACTACPKRTGNQQALFADVESPDMCTDPGCYKAKGEAYWPIRAKEAEAAGQRVVADSTAKKLDSYDSEYVKLEREEYHDGKRRSVESILVTAKKKGVEPPIAIARDPGTGAAVEVISRADLNKAKAALAPKSKTTQGLDAKDKAARQAQLRKDRLRDRVIDLAIAQAVAGAEAAKDTDAILAIIMSRFAARAWNDTQKAVLARRGIELQKTKRSYGGMSTDAEGTLLAYLEELTPTQQRGLGVELALQMLAPRQHHTNPRWNSTLKALGVKLDKLEAQAKAEEKAKAKSKPAAAPAPKASKKKGGRK